MSKPSELQHALNVCIDRLQEGATVEECLRWYPHLAQEMEGLLRVAKAGLGSAHAALPGTGFVAELRYRLLQQAAVQRRPRSKSIPLLRPAAVTMMAVAMLLGAGTGATIVSAESLPGEPLYAVKQIKERIQERLPRSQAHQAQFQATMADLRSQEIAELTERGEEKRVPELVQRMHRHLQRAANLSEALPPLNTPGAFTWEAPPEGQPAWQSLPPTVRQQVQDREGLYRFLQNKKAVQVASLERALQRASPQARPTLLRALQETEARYRHALELLQDTFPPEEPTPTR